MAAPVNVNEDTLVEPETTTSSLNVLSPLIV